MQSHQVRKKMERGKLLLVANWTVFFPFLPLSGSLVLSGTTHCLHTWGQGAGEGTTTVRICSTWKTKESLMAHASSFFFCFQLFSAKCKNLVSLRISLPYFRSAPLPLLFLIFVCLDSGRWVLNFAHLQSEEDEGERERKFQRENGIFSPPPPPREEAQSLEENLGIFFLTCDIQ